MELKVLPSRGKPNILGLALKSGALSLLISRITGERAFM